MEKAMQMASVSPRETRLAKADLVDQRRSEAIGVEDEKLFGAELNRASQRKMQQ
jgi:hypothetical protein